MRLEIRKGVEIFNPSNPCGKSSIFVVIEIPCRLRTTTTSSNKLYFPDWYELIEYDSDEAIQKVRLDLHVTSN